MGSVRRNQPYLAFLCIAFILISLSAYGQWTTDGVTTYNTNSGNVGIGTANPSSKLEVSGGDVVVNGYRPLTISGSSGAIYKQGSEGGWAFGFHARGFSGSDLGGFGFYGERNDLYHYYIGPGFANPHLSVLNSGNVGIGTANPLSRLQVSGGDITVDGDRPLTISGSTGAIYKQGSEGGWAFGFHARGYSGSDLGGFGFYGERNDLFHYYIGPSFVNAFVSVLNDGKVGIGTTSPQAKLHVDGNIVATTMSMTYQDIAEWVPTSRDISPGTVVILDPESTNSVIPSAEAYDTRVAGVVSENPGIVLGEAGPQKERIATTGRVKVRVDASKDAIKIGDLLVTSGVAGTAMRSEPVDVAGVKMHRPGTLIGKALEPLASGQAEILVLLSLQ